MSDPTTLEEKVDEVRITLAGQNEKLKLLDEVRVDVKALRDDVTGLKVKAGIVAAGISSLVAVLVQWLGK